MWKSIEPQIKICKINTEKRHSTQIFNWENEKEERKIQFLLTYVIHEGWCQFRQILSYETTANEYEEM